MTARTETARPRRLSKTDTAYEAVKARILDGTYPAGFRLGLSTLAEEFGMSPLPVREAIRRLEAESLVRFERNIGATVAGMSLHEYAWTIETLAYLEGAAVGASGHLLTKGELKAARKLNRRLADCLDDEDHRMFRTLDQRFHEALVARCENPTIVELLARSWGRLGTSRRMSPELSLIHI